MGNAPSVRETDRPPEPSSPFVLRERLRQLLQVAKGHQRAVVLTHDNPDPDAVASACGLAHLLTRCAGVAATPAYGGVPRPGPDNTKVKRGAPPAPPPSPL